MTVAKKEELKLATAGVLRWLFNALLAVCAYVITVATKNVEKTTEMVRINTTKIAVIETRLEYIERVGK